MAECPHCEYNKKRAQIWRDEAYKLAGHPLPERDPVLEEREACAKLEIELILSSAFFATMGEYDAHKDAVLAYRNLIRARGQA